MKAAPHWQKIGLKQHHGICLPLFSLRTRNSCGIGEFNDLRPIIRWARSLGLDIIQLLPLNDSGNDASPYNAVSSCALDPIYLSLKDLSSFNEPLDELRKLTDLPRIDRPRVKQQKLKVLHSYFQKQFQNISSDPSYATFLTAHPWVTTYAKFMGNVELHCFLQYLCFQQMSAVHQYATSQNVFLLGDTPLLVSRDSVDARTEPHLFNFALEAGAPPDYYTPKGQHWGFPLFNWEAMKQDQFRWWERRLSVLGQYCDLYRIDHVVGFFRIWGIEQGKTPLQGKFFPADSTQWLPQGKAILETLLSKSPLLPIAEDLGSIPPGVRPCLHNLGICTTKVIPWEHIPYNEYEPLSLTTVSTHDSNTLSLWWKNMAKEAAQFAQRKNWHYESMLSTEQRKEILHDSHHTGSLFHINLLQETLALFPELVWERPEDERINVPGTILETNWTYRFRPFVEEIVAHAGLAEAFRELLRA